MIPIWDGILAEHKEVRENNMNLKIREFSEAIRNYVNNTQLPAEVKKIVLKDILNAVSSDADTEILREAEDIKKKEAEMDAESV